MELKELVTKVEEGIPMTTVQAAMKSKDYWKGVQDMIARVKELAEQ